MLVSDFQSTQPKKKNHITNIHTQKIVYQCKYHQNGQEFRILNGVISNRIQRQAGFKSSLQCALWTVFVRSLQPEVSTFCPGRLTTSHCTSIIVALAHCKQLKQAKTREKSLYAPYSRRRHLAFP